MNISPIKTQRDYRNALKDIEGSYVREAQHARGRSPGCTRHAGRSVGAEALSNGSSRESLIKVGQEHAA
jgi:hypothetical protein